MSLWIIKSTTKLQIKLYLYVVISVFVLTFVLKVLPFELDLVNIALLYLFPVLISAVKWGRGPSFLAAGIGVLVFDFFFVPPIYSLTVADLRYVISFFVFLSVATLTASQASRLRLQLERSRAREAGTATLYTLSRELSAITDLKSVLERVVGQLSLTLETEVAIFLPAKPEELTLAAHSHESSAWGRSQTELKLANVVYQKSKFNENDTGRQTGSTDLYLPLRTEDTIHGVLCIHVRNKNVAGAYFERVRFVRALAGIIAISIARIHSEEQAKLAQITAESERLRTSLLNSISHELRTPLSAILGSVTALIGGEDVFSAEEKQELLWSIRGGAVRMNRLVSNLLDMVRLESGMMQLRCKWCDIEDILGVVLRQLEEVLDGRDVDIEIKAGVPLLYADDILLEQVLGNVLSNAVKYSSKESRVEVHVFEEDNSVIFRVRDYGIGIDEADCEHVFEKFYRCARTKHITGTGLGLSICKGIVEAHLGTIKVEPKEVGTMVTIKLPLANDDKKENHANG